MGDTPFVYYKMKIRDNIMPEWQVKKGLNIMVIDV